MGEILNFFLDFESCPDAVTLFSWRCGEVLLKERLSLPEISLQSIKLNTVDLCFRCCLMLAVVLNSCCTLWVLSAGKQAFPVSHFLHFLR
jgi:hypothetical protein